MMGRRIATANRRRTPRARPRPCCLGRMLDPGKASRRKRDDSRANAGFASARPSQAAPDLRSDAAAHAQDDSQATQDGSADADTPAAVQATAKPAAKRAAKTRAAPPGQGCQDGDGRHHGRRRRCGWRPGRRCRVGVERSDRRACAGRGQVRAQDRRASASSAQDGRVLGRLSPVAPPGAGLATRRPARSVRRHAMLALEHGDEGADVVIAQVQRHRGHGGARRQHFQRPHQAGALPRAQRQACLRQGNAAPACAAPCRSSWPIGPACGCRRDRPTGPAPAAAIGLRRAAAARQPPAAGRGSRRGSLRPRAGAARPALRRPRRPRAPRPPAAGRTPPARAAPRAAGRPPGSGRRCSPSTARASAAHAASPEESTPPERAARPIAGRRHRP